eukprot:GHRQ01035103.1.p2 GENE.GHRQ01035103.1~~GHRQ01035103.1.p2  ORF type:complete len:107 (-),score=29.82 GHRQ01035103.1:10-294(-)
MDASCSRSAAAAALPAALLPPSWLPPASRFEERHLTATSVPCHLARNTSPNAPEAMNLQQHNHGQEAAAVHGDQQYARAVSVMHVAHLLALAAC